MSEQSSIKFSISKKFLYWSVVALLLVTNLVTLALWHPWANPVGSGRVISVTGQTVITATPDEYLFQPTYNFTNASKDEALKQIQQKQTELTAKLKDLGVSENKIKSNSSGYGDVSTSTSPSSGGAEAPGSPEVKSTYNLSLEVRVDNKDLAQKVQDYLVTTSPEGQVSPQATFSDKKQKELEDQARTDATKDARAKAEQLARDAGTSLGGVKSIQDGSSFGQPMPMMYEDKSVSSSVQRDSLQIQVGENELNYSVTVEYYLK